MLLTSAALIIIRSQIHNLSNLSQTPIPVLSLRVAACLLAGLTHVSVVSDTADLKITILLQHMIEEEQLDVYCI